MIGLLAAMPSELAYFLPRMEHRKTQTLAAMPYHSGTLDGKSLVICECGVGKVNAAIHTQLMITHYKVDAIIQTGLAGGLSPELTHLSMVIGEELVYHDMQPHILQQFFPTAGCYRADTALVQLARDCAQADTHVGRIATGDWFVDEPQRRQEISNAHHALCCEMEGAAVAQTASLNAVPFVIIRCISDMADEDISMSFTQLESAAAEKAAALVHEMIRRL